jgi:hypothetical protein
MHRGVWLPGHKRQRVPGIVLQACLLKVEAEVAHVLEVASCRQPPVLCHSRQDRVVRPKA